jgi:hypothetical protein
VLRIVQDGARVPALDDPAQVHDRDPVGIGGDGREVVGDHHHRDAVVVRKGAQQVEDLGADADVQHADRLIGHDQVRPQRERGGDGHPLPLAAGQLERQASQVGVHRRHAGLGQGLADAVSHLRRRGADPVDPQRLGHDVEHPHPGVQRLVRVLEDHLHPAAHASQLAARQAAQVAALHQHLASARRQQPQQQVGGGRLARAGLADDGQHLARRHLEADAVHRPDGRGRAEAHGVEQ